MADDTEISAVPDSDKLSKLTRNVARLQQAGAPDEDIDQYLKEQGTTAKDFLAAFSARARGIEGIKPQQYGLIRGALESAANGLTLGTMPQIEGAMRAVGDKIDRPNASLSDLYGAERDAARGSDEAFRKAHPTVAGVSEGVGAVLPAAASLIGTGGASAPALAAIAAARAASRGAAGDLLSATGKAALGTGGTPGAGLARQSAESAALGGAYGAASGAGNNPNDPLAGAARGSIGGAVVGGAAPVVGGAIQSALDAALARLRGGVGGSAPNALGAVPDQMAADAPGAPLAPHAGADAHVESALAADQIDPEKLALQMEQDARAGGARTSLVDYGGANTQGLARSTRALPGPGRNTVNETLADRSNEQQTRVLKDVMSGLGVPPGVNAKDAVDALAVQRQAAATPAYNKAYELGPIEDADVLSQLMQTPAFAKAHADGAALANSVEAGAVKPLFDKDGVLLRVPTVEDIDILKQGLDKRLYDNNSHVPVQGENALDRKTMGALRLKLGSLLEAVDKAVPAYGEAREQFAGHTSAIQAMEEGQSVLTADAQELSGYLKDLDETSKAAFRVGAADGIRAKLASLPDINTKQAVVKAVWGTQAKRDALRAAFPSQESYERFQAQMLQEARMDSAGRNIVGGSQTADKGVEIASNLSKAEQIAGSVEGGKSGMIRGALGQITDRLNAGSTMATRDAVAQRLMLPNTPDTHEYLRGLAAQQRARAAAAAARTTLAAPGATGGGNITGGLLDQ